MVVVLFFGYIFLKEFFGYIYGLAKTFNLLERKFNQTHHFPNVSFTTILF